MKLPTDLKNSFSDFIINNKWLCLFLVSLVLLTGIFGATKIKSDFSYRVWFKEDSPMLKQYDYFEKTFGNDDTLIFVVKFREGDLFSSQNIRLVRQLTDEMWNIPHIIRVDSLDNYIDISGNMDDILVEPLFPDEIEDLSNDEVQKIKLKIVEAERSRDYLVSQDFKTFVVYGNIKPFIGEKPDYKSTVSKAREVVEQYEKKHKLNIHLTGTAAITRSFAEQTSADLKLISPFLITVIVFSIFLIFRSIYPIFLVLSMIGLTIVTSIGIGGLTNVNLNIVTSMLPNILMAISIADSIHLLKSYFKFLDKNHDRKLALKLAIDKVLLPTILTTISTGLGFFSLSFADLQPIASLGTLVSMGTFAALFFTYFWLAPLLVILPIKGREVSAESEKKSSFRFKLATNVDRFKLPIILFFLLITSGSLWISRNNVVNSNIIEYFKPSLPIVVAQRFIEKNVGGIGVIEVVIDTGKENGITNPKLLRQVDAYQDWILEQYKVTKVNSIITVVKEINEILTGQLKIPDNRKSIAENIFLYSMSLPQGMGLSYWTSLDERYLRLKVQVIGIGSHEGVQRINKIRDGAKKFDLNAKITGKASMVASLDEMIVKTFFGSMALAITLVSLFMVIVFRSLKLGLLSMIPNVFPPLIGLGIMNVLNLPIDVSTILITSVCLGIAVDDTIYFISDYHKNYTQSQDSFSSILEVYSHTGSALFWTTFVLVSGFLCFTLGSFTPNGNFGFLTSIVLVLALITDLIMLPALLLITDKRKKA